MLSVSCSFEMLETTMITPGIEREREIQMHRLIYGGRIVDPEAEKKRKKISVD